MSTRWPGGIINQTAPVPSGTFATSAASGLWTLEQQAYWKQQGLWPIPGNVPPDSFIENLFQTYLYTGNGGTQNIVNGINLNIAPTQVSLVGYTITNLGGAFDPSYPIARINDGIVETTNGANLGYVAPSGYFDVYVDMITPTTFVQINIAPQGNQNSEVYNTPRDFIVKGSNNASTWTTVATFSSVSTGYPNWNAGSFRDFSFSNTTAYRYWRFENTSYGSGGAGVSVSELRFSTAGSPTGKNGLVWLKSRSAATNHFLFDTTRGALNEMNSNTTDAQASLANSLTSFNSNGFSLGSAAGINVSAATYCSWTFAQQPKFFDIVTYTGNSVSGRQIAHNLGSVPGMVIVKKLDNAIVGGGPWQVWHNSFGSTSTIIQLNSTAAAGPQANAFNSTAPTSSVFTVGDNLYTNYDGATYVAYLFAHNAGGFGTSGTDNVISCGSFTSNGSGVATVTLGYEPQYVLVKRSSGAGDWIVYDVMRGMSQTNGVDLRPNTSASEGTFQSIIPTATGFNVINYTASSDAIYMAIRRPMKVPTVGTSVFAPVAFTGNDSAGTGQFVTAGFPVDLAMQGFRNQPFGTAQTVDRLRGITGASTSPRLLTYNTNAEAVSADIFGGDSNVGVKNYGQNTSTTLVNWLFRRAAGFMDVVCYTGTGVVTNYNHNLTVVPELWIIKNRSAVNGWAVGSTQYATPTSGYQILQQTNQLNNIANFWQSPTTTTFGIGSGIPSDAFINASGNNYVAYLFATCPGVSKVGSYTGTGATQTINCGFTGGARFVLIKRTDDAGGWYVWDTARGMVSGTNPSLRLNSTAAEVNANSVYTVSTGFQIVSTAADINASGGSYVFLAIA